MSRFPRAKTPDAPSRLRLTTLGTLDLRAPGGSPVQAVLGSPKRTALLLYLACHGEGRFVPRDHLLALLWPEFDDERARNSLRTTLYSLRSALGPGVIAVRPDGSLGIEREGMECDVTAFDGAVEEGRWEEAVRLYRGEFLDGRPILGLAEYEGWVESERARLRRRAMQALWRLSEDLETAGDLPGAVALGRRALNLAPANELTLRRLVSLQYRTGDRSGALDTFEAFERVLRGRFEIEPSTETLALIERIRNGGSIVTAPRSAPTPSPAPPPVPPTGGGALDSWTLTLGGSPGTDQPTARILGFEFAGEADSAYLVAAVRHALMGSLDRRGYRSEVVREAADAPGVAADLSVQGVVVATAGRLRITGTGIPDNGSAPLRTTVEGPSSRLLEMVDALADCLAGVPDVPSPAKHPVEGAFALRP